MIRTTETRERAVYTIRNEDAAPRTVIIEHPVREGWILSPDVKPEESSVDAYRFRVVVEPKHTTEFAVEESTQNDSEILLNNLDGPTLEIFVCPAKRNYIGSGSSAATGGKRAESRSHKNWIRK